MTDLRTALEEAFKDKETTEETNVSEVTPESTPEETVKENEPQARDEHGKFTPKEKEEETPPPRKAPSSWKPAAQEAFLKADRGEALTPEEIRLLTQEAERRENDFHKGVSEFKTHSERARAYDAAIAPFQQHLQSLGVDAPTAITHLMRADYTLRNSDPVTKAQYFKQLAQQYGVDLSQETPQIDQQTQYLMSQLNQLRQTQQMWQNQMRQQVEEQANQELASFATSDKQHFDAVRNDMADLLESGKAKSLQEAYDMAVWMRPDIRQSLIEQQRAEVQQKTLASQQAQRAKTAAVSVKGSSPVSGGIQPTGNSIRDILEQNFAQI